MGVFQYKLYGSDGTKWQIVAFNGTMFHLMEQCSV